MELPLGIELTDVVCGQFLCTNGWCFNGQGVFPKDSYKPVEYPVAILKDHDNADTRDFLNYLESSAAKKIFVEYGFFSIHLQYRFRYRNLHDFIIPFWGMGCNLARTGSQTSLGG